MKNPWKTKGSKIVHENPWYTIRQDEVIRPDGKAGTYNVLETKGDACFIVPLSDKGEIYLIKEYRYPIKEFSWEIPSGNSEGGEVFEAAKRELWEETGFTAGKIDKIGEFYSMNGISSEKGIVFVAKNLTQNKENKQKEEGIFELKKFHFKKVLQMIKDGKISDGQTIAALTQTLLHLGLI